MLVLFYAQLKSLYAEWKVGSIDSLFDWYIHTFETLKHQYNRNISHGNLNANFSKG